MSKLREATFIVFLFINSLAFNSFAQTNVSGNILTNTTWRLINSPYIVTDTVIVFPGVTLTIEPGVVVKFDSTKFIKVNLGNLVAIGTTTDSITFTTNSIDTANVWDDWWGSIYITHSPFSRFNYCNFKYLGFAIWCENVSNDQLYIKNSNFSYNISGLIAFNGFTTIDTTNFSFHVLDAIPSFYRGIMNHCNISNNHRGIDVNDVTLNNCILNSNYSGVESAGNSTFNNCTFMHNNFGVNAFSSWNKLINCKIDSNFYGIEVGSRDSLINCELKYNTTAIVTGYGIPNPFGLIYGCIIENNLTGILANGTFFKIKCSEICNNSIYDIVYKDSSSVTLDATNNYWCTSDQSNIPPRIYDGVDSSKYGLVLFLPIDTLNCQMTNGLSPLIEDKITFIIYPNPASNNFTIKTTSNFQNGMIEISNMLGVIVHNETINSEQKKIYFEIENGIYLVKISIGQKQLIKKLIIEKN